MLLNNNNEITKQFFLYKNRNVMTNNSLINIDNDSYISNSHQSKTTKDQSTSTANTSEALAIKEDISDKNTIKTDVNNTTKNNQNLNIDVKRVRKYTIDVENQLKEIRKNLHHRYQTGQRKPSYILVPTMHQIAH